VDKKESPEERIDRINKTLEDLLSGTSKMEVTETSVEYLAQFGLTFAEAKNWLKNEPRFPSDVSYHEPRNRRKVTRTL
jgi:hypothetical protein